MTTPNQPPEIGGVDRSVPTHVKILGFVALAMILLSAGFVLGIAACQMGWIR